MDPAILVKYKQVMEDLLRKGYARQVHSHDLGPVDAHWYLPHHPVFNPQKSAKIRVVFDCSAVAFMSDVEAMFHQVRVRPSDCDALKFLWWPDGKLDQPPEEF